MTALTEVIHVTAAESYTDLLHSPAHWLFELTVELISAPIAFAVGWLWRSSLLRHLHRDLHSLGDEVAPACVTPRSRHRSASAPQRTRRAPS